MNARAGAPLPAVVRSPRLASGWSLGLTLLVAGLGLGLFDFFSAGSEVARRGLISQRPPVYGRFEPGFSRLGLVALAVAAFGAAGAFLVARRERVRAAWLLPAAVAFLLSFAAATAVVNGDRKAYTDPLLRTRPADYQRDVPVVRALGVRAFVREHPRILPTLTSIHSKTHPPGPVVFLSYLQSASPGRLVPRAAAIAFLGSLVLVPTWSLARRLADERGARYAVLFLAAAPAPVVFAFTSMDAVYASALAAAAALLAWGLGPGGRPWAAFGGGLALGLASILTYAVGFIVVFAVLYALASRPLRDAVRSLAAAAVGGLAALVVLRAALGFDLVASYRASYALLPDDSDRSYAYWLFGNVGVWLTYAGLPIAALSLRELVVRRPAYLLALFAPLLAANLTTIFPAETERIGQFAYPFVAAAAGAALVRWEESSGRRRPGVVGALVGFAALQTVLLEALYYNFW